MRFMHLFAAATWLVSTSSVYHAIAQASVNENEPVTFYVSSASGSDSGPGSLANPFATIQAAVNAAVTERGKAVGVKILVEAGVYREAVTIKPATTSAALTLQASEPGTAIIDGADIATNLYQTSDGLYHFPWTDTVTGCTLPANWYAGMPPVVLANEMVFVNGVMMNQVMSAAQLQPGTFYVNSAGNEVQLAPLPGVDMPLALVEVATRRSTLLVSDTSNLVVRGMVLQHGASCMNTTAATVNSSTNVLFDSDVIQWNNWSGLGFNSSSDLTIENTIADYNGGVGLAGYKILSGLWQGNETDSNNWRGAMVGLYDFGQGGVKLMHVHGGSVVDQASFDNEAQGLWFDTDNQNITIDQATLARNLVGNLQIELNQGPVTVKNSSFCSGGGVQVLETAGLTMQGNSFYGNGGLAFQNAQLFIAGETGGRMVTDWQTDKTTNQFTTNTTLTSNSIVGTDVSQYLLNTYLDSSDWSKFTSTLSSNNNDWFNAYSTLGFGLPAGARVTLAGWQQQTGQDADSVWAAPSNSNSPCVVPDHSFADFQLLAHNAASYVPLYTMSGGSVAIPLQIRSFTSAPVTLSVAGLAPKIAASFSAPSLTNGTSTLSLVAAPSSPPQTVQVTVSATNGSQMHSVTLWVSASTPLVNSSTNLQASGTSVVSGTPVSLTATVLGASGKPTPTGTIVVEINGSSVETLTLAGGSASFTTSSLPLGVNAIEASYSGDSSYAASTSPSLMVSVSQPLAPTPVFAPGGGSFSTPQDVAISDSNSAAVIHFTTDGTTPTASSAIYTGPLYVNATSTLNALAIAPNQAPSSIAAATYSIPLAYAPVNYGGGFASGSGMQVNGKASFVSGVLQLTDSQKSEASSAFYKTQVAVGSFTTTFNLQFNQAAANGLTFVIQNDPLGISALGPANSALGYSYGPTRSPSISHSVAVKLDLYTAVGTGRNSTGLYVNAAHPTLPAMDMTPSGVNLKSGHPLSVTMNYDGAILALTVKDLTTLATYSGSWTVDIPMIVGANQAYVGFTASTGGLTAVQQVLSWTYSATK